LVTGLTKSAGLAFKTGVPASRRQAGSTSVRLCYLDSWLDHAPWGCSPVRT